MLEHICLQLFVILDPHIFFLSLSNYIRNKPLSKAVVHDEERVKQRSGKRFINSLTSITAVARSDSPRPYQERRKVIKVEYLPNATAPHEAILLFRSMRDSSDECPRGAGWRERGQRRLAVRRRT